MAETLPYMGASGLVSKILDKIKEAKTPDRFSQDFLGSVLGFPSGSAKPFIPLAKRLSLINSDGTPSVLYNQFRGGSDESRAARLRPFGPVTLLCISEMSMLIGWTARSSKG